MTRQTVNVGTVANDGTGDPLRTALQKLAANDVELYGAIPGIATGSVPGLIKGSSDVAIANDGTLTLALGAVSDASTTFGATSKVYGTGTGDVLWSGSQMLVYFAANLGGGSGYTLPAGSATVRGGYKVDGTTLTVTGDVLSVAGQDVSSLTDAGALALTDLQPVFRTTSGYQTTFAAQVTLFRKTPAGSRSAALPAVLTATDHDKNISLTGGSGSLSVDGTVGDGFRCFVDNDATGSATYSGITGMLGTTALTSGASTIIKKIGASVRATASTGTTVSTATAYTQSLSASSGVAGSPITMTFTPTAGAWPAGGTLTPSATTVAGTFSPTSITLTATTAAVTCTFTPSSAAGTTGTVTSAVASPTMTNSTGALAFTVTAATATSFTTALSSASGTVGQTPTMTIAPNGNWPTGTLLTPNQSAAIGTYSPTTISPTAGTSTAAIFTLTTTATGTASLSVTESGSAPLLTNTTGSLTYTATLAVPAYPTITGTGTLQAIFDANAGVSLSGGAGTIANQKSGASDVLTATVGVSVGATVNGYPSVVFAAAAAASNSGLKGSPSWVLNMTGACTYAFAFKTGSTVSNGDVLVLGPGSYTGSNQTEFNIGGTAGLFMSRRNISGVFVQQQIATGLQPNTLYKVLIVWDNTATSTDVWVNGTKTTYTISAVGTQGSGQSIAYIGQNPGATFGGINQQFLEAHLISGLLNSTDQSAYVSYLTSKWG